ncbi:hypothetical protein [Plantactinospora sonchi]|uniref:DUF4345 domain-containing protein n=1 Tax=Plantactinospora sonchi TaxID=1544735 RepID=A0ABU7RW67_9ACTN
MTETTAGPPDGGGTPAPVRAPAAPSRRLRVAAVLVWVLVVEHAFALVTPPYELGVEHAFHLTFGAAYAWLALRLPTGRRAHRALLTVLLGIQLVGRCVVFTLIPDTWIRALLVLGALLTVVVVTMLWRPTRQAANPPR